MRYTVEGLDRRTGRGAVVDVEATSLRDAENQALAAHVLPSKVYPARDVAVAAGAAAAAAGESTDLARDGSTRPRRQFAAALLTAALVLLALAVAGGWAARRHQRADRARELGRQRNTQMFIDYEQSRARLNPIVMPRMQARAEEHARRGAAGGSADAGHAAAEDAEREEPQAEHAEASDSDVADEPVERDLVRPTHTRRSGPPTRN